jgi:deoxyadenosine/deoxycytidine kinase
MIISINGNIGSGKSTLMDSIKEEFKHFHHIQEPVHKWTKLLENFYNDPSKWALPFQIKVLTSQMSSFHEYENKICMVERDPITARYIFWESLYHNKTITPEEYDVYNDLYKIRFFYQPEMVFYIKTTPEVCWERIQKRSRSQESGIEFDYIKNLHTQHEEIYSRETFHNFYGPKSQLHIIDGNKSAEEVRKEIYSILEEFHNSISLFIGTASSSVCGGIVDGM